MGYSIKENTIAEDQTMFTFYIYFPESIREFNIKEGFIQENEPDYTVDAHNEREARAFARYKFSINKLPNGTDVQLA